MPEPTAPQQPERLLGAQAEGEWWELEAHLQMVEGFFLGFLFTVSPVVTAIFRRRVAALLEPKGGELRELLPAEAAGLEAALAALLLDPPPVNGLVWIESLAVASPGQDWPEAWCRFVLRLNERRDRTRRHIGCGLLLALRPELKPRVRELAPDLWTIRAFVLEPRPVAGLRIPAEMWESAAFQKPPDSRGCRERIAVTHRGLQLAGETDAQLLALASDLLCLGIVSLQRGELREAAQATGEGVGIARSLVQKRGEGALREALLATGLLQLTAVYVHAGDLPAAEEAMRELHHVLGRMDSLAPETAMELQKRVDSMQAILSQAVGKAEGA